MHSQEIYACTRQPRARQLQHLAQKTMPAYACQGPRGSNLPCRLSRVRRGRPISIKGKCQVCEERPNQGDRRPPRGQISKVRWHPSAPDWGGRFLNPTVLALFLPLCSDRGNQVRLETHIFEWVVFVCPPDSPRGVSASLPPGSAHTFSISKPSLSGFTLRPHSQASLSGLSLSGLSLRPGLALRLPSLRFHSQASLSGLLGLSCPGFGKCLPFI